MQEGSAIQSAATDRCAGNITGFAGAQAASTVTDTPDWSHTLPSHRITPTALVTPCPCSRQPSHGPNHSALTSSMLSFGMGSFHPCFCTLCCVILGPQMLRPPP